MPERPTVVIVDDSAELRVVVRSRLEASGLFDVVGEAGDGGEAMLLAHKLSPTLMLLDTSMPIMDGLEALPLVLAVSPDTKVVVFTGFEEVGLAIRARELGAVDLIEKSVPIDKLPELLWQHVGGGPEARPPRPGGLRIARGIDQAAARDQAALDEHLERYREVFHQAAIGMATMTLNGSIVRANSELAAMVHREPADLVGLDYGVLTRRHGDQLDDALARITEGDEELATFEHPLVTDDGASTLRVSLAPIRDSAGKPLYVFAQVQDITPEVELRRSEEMFRLLVTAVRDYAIYMLDVDGRVASWNAGAQNIKGYAADEILGRHYRVFYPEAEREARHPEHNLQMALREGAYAEEGWRVRRDGSRFWASVVITAVYDDAGRHRGFAKVTRDQTQQRAHEEQRRRAIEQQAQLLAITAHELRTPTAVIEGSVSMLREGDDLALDELSRLLDAMSSSAQRLQRLVADLSSASNMHADALALRPERLSLQATLIAAAERVRAVHPTARIGLDVAQDVDLVADPARVGQALDNLLENALRHGRTPVMLHGEPTEDGVRVLVSDAGPGVEPRLVDRLFERFAHAGSAGSTGLGLHLVREIARSHGGEVSYLPPGDGRRTAFAVELPSLPRAPGV
ncbi:MULTISPECIES: PAS domain S-box protein [Nocardioides]|uniref:histidine kinase n=1 Tax=Nocardioides vastitatis TaxID=2568655 RepID=A0ABW0ZFT2_9ACTN|nr:PAS domain S-box protein [Nocardioides sp.]THJ01222.1 PAS domain S-box protein [Nocardioides sp.]